MIDPEANATAAEFVHDQIREHRRPTPTSPARLLPTTYPFGTKRVCLDTGYYATFNRENVTLVDVRATPIVEIVPAGVRTTDTTYELDALVFATGFDAMTGALLAPDIVGVDGLLLRDAWSAGPRTYLGPGHRRVPEPVHDHRARQPVGAHQHAGVDRAARGVDHRLHRPPRGRAPGHHRGRPRRPRTSGSST